MRVPRSFHAAHDDDGRYVMVLEDLQAAGARYPGASDPHLAAFVEGTIDALAALHAAFWGSPRFAEDGDLAWVEHRSRTYGSAAPLVTFAVEQLGDRLPPASRELGGSLSAARGAHPGPARRGNADPDPRRRAPRQPVRARRRAGLPRLGDGERAPGLRDVAYFLGDSVPTELRRARERDLVARYCAQLRAGGAVLDVDEAWQQYRLHLLTAWIAAVVTAAMGSHWQPIEIGMAATRRADAAIAEHGVAELLRARLP